MAESNRLQLQIHGVDGQEIGLFVDRDISGGDFLNLVREHLPAKPGFALCLLRDNATMVRRETLQNQGVVSSTMLHYIWTLPKFQEVWKLLMGHSEGGSTEDAVAALEGIRSLSLTAWPMHLENVELPSSLEELRLVSLAGVLLPRRLQTLTFDDGFNEHLTGIPFPCSLQTIRFGKQFDKSLEQVCWPESLHTVAFGD